MRGWPGLALAIVLAGIASILLRQDSNWDLQNYHLYNAWAFVHDRYGLDWAPAQLQSFHSPYLDLPFFALLAADTPPRVIAFALAIPTGIAWYCYARIAAVLFGDLPDPLRMRAIVVAIALGVTAPMSVSLIGLTMNDWYTAAFVLLAVWIVVAAGDPLAAPCAHVVRGGTPGRRRRGLEADRFDLRRRAGRGGARRARQPARASRGCGGDGGGGRAGLRAHRRAVDADDARALRQSALSLFQRRVPLAMGRSRVVRRDAFRSGVGGRVAGVPVHAAVETRRLRVRTRVPRRASRAPVRAGARGDRRGGRAPPACRAHAGRTTARSGAGMALRRRVLRRVVRRVGGAVPDFPVPRAARAAGGRAHRRTAGASCAPEADRVRAWRRSACWSS